MLISIIIPAFNEEQLIEHTVDQINSAIKCIHKSEIVWEMIICDNNSTDKTAELASKMGANVVFEPVNQISRARNTGAEKAEGDWFLFIDADTYPSLELIEEVVDLIEEDKHIGCGSTIRVEGGTLFNKLRLERMNPIFRLLNLCGGAFLLCCRKGFESINGFSNNLYAYEEVDFVIRLKKYGRTLEKGFKILHHHPVVTSGRKGEYRFFQMLTLFVSNFMAVFIFALHYILPEQYIRKLGSRWLRYWYNNRR